MRELNCFKTYVALVLFSAFFLSKAHAETPVESSIESRLYLTFQAQEATLQNLLPTPWQVNAISNGPSKGANLTVIFIQTLVCDTPEGKPSPSGGSARYVLFTVHAKNAQTGEESVFIPRIYTTDPDRAPGHYKNAIKADIRREQSIKTDNIGLGTGSDYWEMMEAGGGIIKVHLDYKRSALNHLKWERIVRTTADPSLSFIYRVDQSGELLKSEVSGVDLLTSYDFMSTVAEQIGYLNDETRLIGVTEIPNFIANVSQR